ncbi:MAG: glucodextranase DOMON-like domain-containing protein [Candidatus Zixiibacteriota bacterium]
MLQVINPKTGKRVSVLLVFAFVLGWHPVAGSSSSVDGAKECFEAYIRALQQGSAEEAAEFWNRQEVQRYKKYDWQWEYLTFRRLDPRHLNYRIVSADEREDYVVLQVEWFYREGKAGCLQKDVRYFVEEDGRMVGANPIFIRTKGWLRRESEHFVYYYRNIQDEPGDALLSEMDEFYEELVELLQVDYRDKIDYYKCASSEEVGRLFGLEPSLARSQTVNGVVTSIQKFVPHEIVHIIAYRILPQDEQRIPAEYLSEGLAYYMGGASFFSPELLLSWAKGRIDVDKEVSLDSLIRDPWLYGNNDGAGLVSSFVKFLIENQGISKFKQLFAAGETFDDQREALKKIYGKGTNQLQAEWKESVLSLALPEVAIVDGIRGGEVFHMLDPLGDDKGEGDYTYPENQRAIPGIFDLIGFRISSDDELVYFQLQFANLNPAEIRSDEGFNGTFAAIVMDCDDKAGSGNTRLFFDNGNLEFSQEDAYEFVIEVSNAGILVYDKDWVWHLLFLKALSKQDHIRGNEVSFAIPRKIIGRPGPTWKLQVLTGGQTGGHKNTAYGVGKFMTVGEQSRQQQGGGGTDAEFNPNVYDILIPKGADQMEILGSYDATKKKRVIIPMISVRQW